MIGVKTRSFLAVGVGALVYIGKRGGGGGGGACVAEIITFPKITFFGPHEIQ